VTRSYLLDFLTHPMNQTVAGIVLAAGALASMPYGFDALGLSVLALAAIEVVGAAVIPGLPMFRAAMDQRATRKAREARRANLIGEIESHGGSRFLSAYVEMRRRVDSLYRTAHQSSNSLSEREVEQLEEVTVSYLRLCLADAMLSGRNSEERFRVLKRQLSSIDARLAEAPRTHEDVAQLQRAKAEYEESIAREMRMASRRSALEASLSAIPVRVEEIYQTVMMAPVEGKLSELLEQSASRLRVEEVDIDVEAYFGIKASEPARAVPAEPATTAPATVTGQASAARARRPTALRTGRES
jgi:hypothetical protein